ncbi:hypothetical protein SLA2020_079490 [Shorea laevis]
MASAKILAWNCRGLGNSMTLAELKKLLRIHTPQLLFLSESKRTVAEMDRIRLELGFSNCFAVGSNGRSGGLAMLWNEEVQVQLLSYSLTHIDMEIQDLTNTRWRVTGFYGQPDASRRHESWALLKSLKSSSSLPWVCVGDFNEIVKQAEKMGGNSRSERQIESFCEAIEYCGFSELDFKGPRFTFVRKQQGSLLRERLDRVLMNRAWAEQFPGSISHHLPTIQSDHSAILLSAQRNLPRIGRTRMKQFRFENYWLQDTECEAVVKEAWQQEVGTTVMDNVLGKMHRCRDLLSDWNAHKYGNIPERIKMLQFDLQQVQDGSASDCSLDHFEAVEKELRDLQKQEEVYWKQ